jgi:urease accessory protein
MTDLPSHASSLSRPPVADTVAWLQLLHLADSALPIGALAHSFGVETLVAEAGLTVAELPVFFDEWLSGAGHTEAAFCLWAHAIRTEEEWRALNHELSSFKPPRESREASLRLGKRFLALAAALIETPSLNLAGDTHIATAFGRAGAELGLEKTTVAAAYLHSALFGAVSVCQRLLPLGQSAAMRFLWQLKPRIVETVKHAANARPDDLWNLQPLLEIGSMRHPQLTTRLFIS